jgi:PAS domain S-box-containing protein
MMSRIKLISLMLDREGCISYCNDYLLDLTEWRREEVFGRDWFDLFIPAEDDNVKRVFEDLLNDLPEAWHHENEILTKSGERRLIRWNNSLLRSATGEVIGTASIGEDITERTRAEERRRESDERFRQLAERITNVFWMSDKNMAQMLYVSPAYEQIWGRPCSSLYERSTSFAEAVHPQDRARLEAVIELKKQGIETEIEYRILRPDGSERWIFARSFPVRNEAGGFYRIAGIAEDITERKRGEVELRRSEADLAEAQRVAKVGSWSFEIASGSTRWSQELYRIFDIDEKVLGISYELFLSRVHPDDRSRVIQTSAKARAGGNPFEVKYRVPTSGGELKTVREIGYAVKDAAGKVVGLFGTAQDITEREQAETALRQSREQLRSLLARLQRLREEERTRMAREVHDVLGQMLTGLKMDMSWWERRFAKISDEPLRHAFEEKVAATSHLADLMIEAVQKISRELRPSILDNIGLGAALQFEARQFQERTGIVCAVSLIPETESFPLGPDVTTGVFRVFQELLTNVARHARATQIAVELTQTPESVRLEIKDNGRGIRGEELQDPKSLGILGITERALLMGGKIEIIGSPGGGTRAALTIPWELDS